MSGFWRGKSEGAFDNIFAYNSEADKIESNAKLLMAKFLSKVQDVADKKNINRKELAKLIGTSPSYLTQLFRGHKNLNFLTLAKLENALNIKFEISLKEEVAGSSKMSKKETDFSHDDAIEDKEFENKKPPFYSGISNV